MIAMRIGMLSAAPFPPVSPEGIANYVYNITSKLLEKGHEVTVITRGSGARIQHDLVRVGRGTVRVFRVPTIPVYPFHVHLQGVLMRRLIGLLESNLDVLHVHSPYVPAVKTSVPVITTIHTLERVDIGQYEKVGLRRLAYMMSANIFGLMESKLFGHTEMLTAVSDHVFAELRRLYGISREGTVLGNGVDVTQFVPCVDKPPGGQEYVLYVGRMDYRKGLFDLTRCAKYVCEERPDVLFVLVGNGPLASSIDREARRVGIDKNIMFAGYVKKDRLIEFYQRTTACVLPSYYEGLPTVMLEAMACGVPVVATRIGGHLDVISDGLNGFLVPVKSPEQMAERILLLLRDRAMGQKIGAAARETIVKQYTWDAVSDKLMHCYTTLLGESGK